jgi:hypothetical protein
VQSCERCRLVVVIPLAMRNESFDVPWLMVRQTAAFTAVVSGLLFVDMRLLR